MTVLVDHNGQPLRRELLTRDVAGPTLAGVRQPVTGYPGDGLMPTKLARILREADQNDPLAYFELAEQIEERDLHYNGVLGTRKRSVSQVDVSVEAASDDAEDVKRADMVREWLKRDELADETFDMLDAIGKGTSWTEIIWDTSEGQYRPARLEWRDPRWFRFDRDGQTPLLRGGEDGASQDEQLPAFKFVRLSIKAKSGLPIRSGLARLAAWSWMFKAYTQRDWAIFTQTYGQPVRIGRYHAGATPEDRDTLFKAVANIAGDCAAIVPMEMQIEFVESKNVADGSALYEKRSDWLDRQVSKAVLGQTNTTDAQAGGLGSGQAKVHNDVREDIETADCKGLSAALNRDLVRPWCDLEFGPGVAYPRIVIARPKQEDLQMLADSLQKLVPMGLRVSESEVRDKFGLSEPQAGDDVLRGAAPGAVGQPPIGTPPGERPAISIHQAELLPEQAAELIARQLVEKGGPAVTDMAATIEAMLEKAHDLGEFRMMLSSAYGQLDSRKLAELLAGGLAVAHAAGRSDLVDESE
jgi:phage gp29-like protein